MSNEKTHTIHFAPDALGVVVALPGMTYGLANASGVAPGMMSRRDQALAKALLTLALEELEALAGVVQA